MKTIKNSLVFSLIIVLFSLRSLLSMEQGIVTNDQSLAWFCLLTTGVKYVGHDDIVSLVLVRNKNIESALFATTPHRKEYMMECLKENPSIDQISVWYKYGSACGHVYGSHLPIYKKALFLCADCFYLYDNKEEKVLSTRGKWNNYSKSISQLSKGGFDIEGNFHCYAIDNFRRRALWGSQKHLTKYYLTKDGDAFSIDCGLRLAKHNNITLATFASLPVLLKAFLNCSFVKTKKNKRVIYNFNDVVIPNDYKSVDPAYPDTSFENLPEDVKNAITVRYNEQLEQKSRSVIEIEDDRVEL